MNPTSAAERRLQQQLEVRACVCGLACSVCDTAAAAVCLYVLAACVTGVAATHLFYKGKTHSCSLTLHVFVPLSIALCLVPWTHCLQEGRARMAAAMQIERPDEQQQQQQQPDSAQPPQQPSQQQQQEQPAVPAQGGRWVPCAMHFQCSRLKLALESFQGSKQALVSKSGGRAPPHVSDVQRVLCVLLPSRLQHELLC